MPTISKTRIRRPRKTWRCETCSKLITGPHWRLYGYAHRGDPKYVVRLCDTCETRHKE